MATITINIPVNKEAWVLGGFAIRYGYEVDLNNPNFDDRIEIPNPAYDDQIAEDPDTNPTTIPNPDFDDNLTIPNPETLPKFVKRIIIHIIKNEANTGHNQADQEANALEANDVTLS
jgi:hypothetical protein